MNHLPLPLPVQTCGLLVPSAVAHMQQPLKLDCLWAALCLPGAVYLVFRP